MAIHNNFPGLTVELVTDGSPLREYEIEEASPVPNTVMKYVEAEAGAEFAIRLHISADGNALVTRVFHREEMHSRAFHTISCSKRLVDSKWVKQTFCFSAVNTTDDAGNTTETLEQSVRNLGEITVSLEFGQIGKVVEPRDDATNGFMGLPVVPETALKGEGKSLQVSVGAECKTSAPRTYKWKSDSEEPFALFKLRYRSKANLEGLHALHRRPTAVAVPTQEAHATSSQTHVPTIGPEHDVHTALLTRQSSALTSTSVSRQQSSAPYTPESTQGLDEKELIALIVHYRGHRHGLDGQGRRHLQVLLKHYEDQEIEGATPQTDSLTRRNHGKGIKREGATTDSKRKRVEVIVLDD